MNLERSPTTPSRKLASKPAAVAPATSGRSAGPLSLRWIQLLAGLLGYAISIVLMLQSGLGPGGEPDARG